jgi:DNA primase
VSQNESPSHQIGPQGILGLVSRISEETIQRVAEANDIVEVIGSYFPLKRAGTSWRALCPFHREKSPSFHVNPQRQSYHCFGCGAGGTIFRFVMDYEHLDFPAAVRRLAQRAGVPVVEEAASAEDDRSHALRKRLLALHAEAAAWFHSNLLKAPAAQEARDYLKSRAVSLDIAKSWLLGYAPDSRNALTDFLRGRQFSAEEIVQSGLAAARDAEREVEADVQDPQLYARFRGRVIFPIRNDYGEVIAFSGRVLDPGAKSAKYVNSPETPLFTKGRVLYGLDKSKRALIEANAAIVCEGQLDLISAFEAGVQNVIAPQGTAFTPVQARLLRRFVESVILCFDSDQAGREAIDRSMPALLECGLDVRVASLPEGEDPDSLIRRRGVSRFREVIDGAPGFFDHSLERLAQEGTLDNPAGKSSAARQLGPLVATIKDPVLREATANRICARLGITQTAFAANLKPIAPAATIDSTESSKAIPLPLNEGLRQLCRLGLMHAESRAWLRSRPQLPYDILGEGGKLLEKILNSSLPLEKPTARAAFTSDLSPQEEMTVARLDLDRMPDDPLRLTKDEWSGLSVQHLQERNKQAKSLFEDRKQPYRQQSAIHLRVLEGKLETAKSRLKDTALETNERKGLEEVVTNLTKQILDLQS